MAVFSLLYLIKGEGCVPNQLCIFEHVHAPATRLLGWSEHFYESQEAIQIIIRHFKIQT
jgi:hypothetical protein